MSLPYSSTMAAEDDEKAESAALSAEVLADAVRKNLTSRQIMTRKAFENAIAFVMATGGSTNAVLHLLAIAHSSRVSLTLDDFEFMRERVPVLCDLKPSGKYVASDSNRSKYYYCVTDDQWKELKAENLIWSDDPAFFEKRGLKLHQPC